MSDLYVTNHTQNLNNASSSIDVLFKWNLDAYKNGSHFSINDHAGDLKYSKLITNDGNLNSARTDPTGANGGNWAEFSLTLQYNMLYNILLSDASGALEKSYLLTPSNLNVSFVTTNNDIFTQDVNVDVSNYMLSGSLLQDLSNVPFEWKPELSVVNFTEGVLHVSDNFNTLTDLSSTLYDSNNLSVNENTILNPLTNYNVFHKMVLDYSYNTVDVKLKGFDVESVVRTDQYPHAVNLPTSNQNGSGFYELTRDSNDFATQVDISWNNPNNLNIADVSLGLYYVVTLTQDNNNTDFSDIDISKVVLATNPNNASFTIGVSGDIVAVNTSKDITLVIVSHNTNTTNDIDSNLAEESDLFRVSNVISFANPPNAPTGVVLTRVADSGTSIDVSWNAPSNDGGKPITNYVVSYANADGSTDNGEVSNGDASTKLTLTGLTEGATYNVNVRAVNIVQHGPVSSPDVSLNPALAPAAPTGVVLTRVDNIGTSLDVSWNAPADNGDDITNYVVSYANADLENFATDKGDVSNGDASTSLRLNPLTQGATYNVNVRAVNDVSGGPVSSPDVSLNPALAPAAPTGVVLTRVAGSGTSLDVSWNEPLDNGDDITNYIVSYANADDPTDKGDVSNGDATRSLRLESLTEGATYNVNVRAVNDVSGGPVSSPDVSLNPALAPDAPTDVVLTRVAGSGTSLQVSWTEPKNNGDTIDYSFVVLESNSNIVINGSTVSAVSAIPNGSINNATITGLSEGVNYYVKISVYNSVGASSFVSSNGMNPALVPDTPTNVVLTRAATSDTLNLNWVLPDANGDNITNHSVIVYQGNVVMREFRTNSSSNTTTIDLLTEGTYYTASVAALNDVGVGPAGNSTTDMNPALVPNVPTFILKNVLDNNIELTITPPDNNGDLIFRYTVETTDSVGGVLEHNLSNTELIKTFGPVSADFYTGNIDGASTSFKVQATNDVGASGYSATQSIIVSSDPIITLDASNVPLSSAENGPVLRVFSDLTVPQSVYQLNYKLELIDLCLNPLAPQVIYDYKLKYQADNGNPKLFQYNNGGGWKTIPNNFLTYTHDISSANPPVLGKDYKFVVTLSNDPSFNSGVFEISAESDVIRAAVLPPAPTINNVTMDTNSYNVTVDWSNNTTKDNIDISYNEISIISDNNLNNSRDLSNQRVDVLDFSINTLLLGQAYTISVSSVNTLGEGVADTSSVTVVGEPTFELNSIEVEYLDASGDLVVNGSVVTKGNETRVDLKVLESGDLRNDVMDNSYVLPFQVDVSNNNIVDFSFNVSNLSHDMSYNFELKLYLKDGPPGPDDIKDDFSLNNVLLFNKAEPPRNVVLNRSETNTKRSLTVTFDNPSHNGSSNKYQYTLNLLDVDNNDALIDTLTLDQSNVTVIESNSHTFVDNNDDLSSNYKVVVNVTQYDENGALLTELSSNIVYSNETYFSLDPSTNIQLFKNYVTDFSNNFLVNYKDNTFDFAVKYDLSMYDLKDFDLTVELKDSSDTLVQDLSYNTNNASDISFSFNDISLNNTYKLELNLNVTDWDSPLNQIEDISHTVDLFDTSLNDKFDVLSFNINTSNISDSKLTLTVDNIQKTGNYNNLSDDSLNVLCNISVVDGPNSVVVLDLSSVYSTNLSFNVDISNVDISNGTTNLTQLISRVSLNLYSDSRSMDLSKNNIVEKYLLFKPSLLSADLSDNTYTVKFYNGFSSGEVLYINTSNGNMDSSNNTYVDNDYVKNDDGIQSMDITGVTAPEVDGNSWFILVNESGASVYQIYGGSGPDNNINNVTNLS
jgi:hypothetical protein